MTTAAILLHFFCYVRQAHVSYIARYMDRAWHVPRRTVLGTLSKLVRDGRIVRVGYARYGRTIQGSAGADSA